jgi:hypothetical protein
MRRAEPLRLHDRGMRGRGGGGLRHVRPDDHDDAVEHRGAAVDEVAQHGLPGDRVQRFREGRFHAGAESRGQDDCGGGHKATR